MRRSRRADPPRPAATAARLLLLLLLIAPGIGASARVVGEVRTLYLEVFVNGRESGFIARFVETEDGDYLADAAELRNVGVQPGTGRSGDLRLSTITGASFRIEEATQRIFFTLDAAARAPRVIDASGHAPDEARSEIDSGFGLVLNYGLDFEHVPAGGTVAAGVFDSRLFMPMGSLNHGFTLSESGQGATYQRLDSYWQTPDAKHALQFQLGDMVTHGPEWAHPLRLGGVQIKRNFALRPDLVTMPLPGLRGSAAVPTTVEVYTESLRRYATDVPEGPFELLDLPLTIGVNEAMVVLTDATGRQVQQTLPFLVTPELLRHGLADYSLSYGYPRRGFGTETDEYGDTPYGVASLRYGLSDRVTLSAHAESGGGLRMAGLGGTFRLGNLGTASTTAAFSDFNGQEGALVDVSSDLRVGGLRLFGRVMHSDASFMDVARVTTLASPSSDAFVPLRDLRQLALSVPVGGDWHALGLKYADAERLDGQREHSLGLTTSRSFGGRSSLYLSALAVETEVDDDIRLSAGFHMPLGGRVQGSAGVSLYDRRSVQTVGASRSAKPGEWNWQIRAVRDSASRLSAAAGRDFEAGRVDLAARVDASGVSTGLRLDGALTAAGGGLFLSERIDDAFAVIDAGAPGVNVAFENRPAGTTGRSGKILVPGLRSYQKNALSIDPTGLPVEAAIGTTHEVVMPAHHSGVVLDFGVDTAPSAASVYLVDASGQPVRVGLTATLEGGGESRLVGYDGMVFLTGLRARNRLTVARPDGERCAAEFAYRPEPGTIPEIRGIPCR
ncbi:fimbria/pilus outer membrane usher protein [Actibacterium sp. MT2.3-13A]|uniref:fimbria/pilus outer membrane usher protein n=1 Tax=Actibacterium sp. MT2.3-13A TaxID=2828332 RepID=UPI001BAB3D02|nr:fimbria/pilus outer membrane usher protein [Actibacterium sp. MT2.3-13A]